MTHPIPQAELPGDLQHAVDNFSAAATIFREEPALLLVWLSLKYGPVRDKFVERWRTRSRSGRGTQ